MSHQLKDQVAAIEERLVAVEGAMACWGTKHAELDERMGSSARST